MAIVRHVRIEGLAGQDRVVDVRLNRGMNVFYGVNGSGKTSFLKLLDRGIRNSVQGLPRVQFKNASVELEVSLTSNRNRVVTRTISRPRKRLLSELSPTQFDRLIADGRYSPDELSSMADDRELYIDEPWAWKSSASGMVPPNPSFYGVRYLPASRITGDQGPFQRQGRARGSVEVLDEAQYDALFAATIQAIWERYSRRELVRVREIQQEGIAAILNSVIARSRDVELGTSLEISSSEAYDIVDRFLTSQKIKIKATLKQFTSSYERENVLRGVVEEIIRVEERIVDAQKPSRQIESIVDKLFTGKKHLDLATRQVSILSGGDTKIPIELLSSGEKQLILILLETAVAENNAILIDEPELSMHVDWQRELISAMRAVNPDAQVIIATHSPEVLANIAPDEYFEL